MNGSIINVISGHRTKVFRSEFIPFKGPRTEEVTHGQKVHGILRCTEYRDGQYQHISGCLYSTSNCVYLCIVPSTALNIEYYAKHAQDCRAEVDLSIGP